MTRARIAIVRVFMVWLLVWEGSFRVTHCAAGRRHSASRNASAPGGRGTLLPDPGTMGS